MTVFFDSDQIRRGGNIDRHNWRFMRKLAADVINSNPYRYALTRDGRLVESKLPAAVQVDLSSQLQRPDEPKTAAQAGLSSNNHRQRKPGPSPPDGLKTAAQRSTTIAAAAILGIKSRKLQAMSQRGEIPGAAKLGRQWTYDLAKLHRFVEQQEQATCQNEKPRRAATGATEFSMPSFRSGGDKSGGRLGQMIRQLQKRVAKQSKSEH
jgi:hypothetical protein